MTLHLRLLGTPEILLNGEPLSALTSKKACALLFYLAVEGQTHSREKLASFLWGDRAGNPDRSLRVDLTHLNRHLGGYIIAREHSLAFNGESEHLLDLRQFEQVTQAGFGKSPPTIAQLEEAAALYRGEFLDNFRIHNPSPEYEEWMLRRRESLRSQLLDVLNRLVHYYLERGDPERGDLEAGLAHVLRLLDLEPWMEEAHRSAMRLFAMAGQPARALAQYNALKKMLADEFDHAPAAETEDLYRRIATEAESFLRPSPATAPDATTQAAPRALPPASPWEMVFQAPSAPRYFVGREEIVNRLRQKLAEPKEHNIHALVGMAGVGKTTLAIHLAHRMVGHFADGVLWGNAGTSDLMVILDSWAQAYGYDFSRLTDLESRAAALRSVLAHKHTLIILDNVTDPAGIELLIPGAAAPGRPPAVLITTRDIEVAVALDASEETLPELDAEAGRKLFAEILGPERVAAETEAVDAICALLQYLPLALEITAKRLKTPARQSIAAMLERLRRARNRLPELRFKDAEVRASFAVSWEALPDDLCSTFAALAVFGGRPFTPDALAHVRRIDRYTAADHLIALLRLSLVSERNATHFQQHALLADFATEKLEAGKVEAEKLEDARAVHLRAATYFMTFARLFQKEPETLEREWANLNAALATLREQEQWADVLAFCRTLTPIWFGRAHFGDARQGYAWAHEASLALGDRRAGAWALCQWARACLEQADYDEAERLLSRSLALYAEIDDVTGKGEALQHRGRIALERSEFETARALLQESRALLESVGDEIGAARSLWLEADIHYSHRRHEQARELANRALQIQRRAGDALGSIQTLGLLADIAANRGAYELADKYCRDAIESCDAIHDRCERAIIHYIWSKIYRAQEKPNLERARNHALTSLDLLRRMGDRQMQVRALRRLSAIELDLGNVDRALSAAEEGYALNRELRNEWGAVYDLDQLAQIHRSRGDHEAYRAQVHQALLLARKFADHPLTETLSQAFPAEA